MSLKPYTAWKRTKENVSNVIFEELKQVGLVSIKGIEKLSEMSFLHHSFFEFFYAKILTDATSKFLLRNAVFNHVYSSFDFEGVEEFLVGSVNLLQEESYFKPQYLQFPRYLFQKLFLNSPRELITDKFSISMLITYKMFFWSYYITCMILQTDVTASTASHGFTVAILCNVLCVPNSCSSHEQILLHFGAWVGLIIGCCQAITLFTYPSKSSNFFDLLKITNDFPYSLVYITSFSRYYIYFSALNSNPSEDSNEWRKFLSVGMQFASGSSCPSCISLDFIWAC